jgi:hypothetical protein
MDSLAKLRNDEHVSTLQREFGKQLHAIYDAVAKDELPPRMAELIQRLDKSRH